MKRNTLIFFMLTMVLALPSCFKDDCEATRRFVRLDPIFLHGSEFRTKTITSSSSRALENPGKIYFYNNYILINELREGIHLVNNSDPANPAVEAFIEIPGNVDMVMKGNKLIVDSYVDMLVIDISNPAQPVLETRLEEVYNLQGKRGDGAYLAYYQSSNIEEEIPCDNLNFNGGIFWRGDDIFVDAAVLESNGGSADQVLADFGVAGSLSRFALAKGYLYAVDQSYLKVFDIQSLPMLDELNSNYIGWDIETIFPYQDKLFIGSGTGMFIFDNSNPVEPVMLSVFQHARACDPVYVKGNLAYVTLRDGTTCENFNNQLDVVDVTNLSAPHLIETYPMHNPHGLSIKDRYLYLCEGDEGLKVFDVTDVNKIDKNQVDHLKGYHAFDVITLPNDYALMIGDDGFYQFDISNPEKIKEVSKIPVTRK